ncbi:MAG: helix-turn-helix domain-containing protein [Paraglaciecola sp.]|uniref:helix-turn-helix domain-containing protein n=1 Tax=Paraglaciecola sp. TaxID=1920173 RepID=UPI003296A07F
MNAMPSPSFEDWKADVCDSFCKMDVVRTGPVKQPFIGGFEHNELNHIRLCTVQSKAVCVDTPSDEQYTHLSGKEYLVKFQLRGNGRIEHHGRVAELTPGDFMVWYNEEPIKFEFKKLVKHAVLVIPSKKMHQVCPDIDQYLGLLFDKSETTNSLLSQYVINLTQKVDTISPEIVIKVEHILLELLGTALSAVELPNESETLTTAASHLKSIKTYIVANLDNPDLSPDYLADKERISKRYLHQLFVNEGISVSRFIQLQRLEACKKALASPNMENMSITDIALEWCFADVSHFHRCFKAQYKVTPRKYRTTALAC